MTTLHCRACGYENPPGTARCLGCRAHLGPTVTPDEPIPLPPKEPPASEAPVQAKRPTAAVRPQDAAKTQEFRTRKLERPQEPLTPPVASPRPPLSRPTGQHYLIASILGEPVELSADRATRIGRDPENEVVFPLQQVSRQHAEIRWDGAAFNVVDRGSVNGTFVNGTPVRRKKLEDGDRIGIGPFSIVYRNTTGGAKKPVEPGNKTDRIHVGGLAGEIAEMPLFDVLKALEAMKKTGELSAVLGDGSKGTFYLRDGRAVHAECGTEQGEGAAVTLLRAREGSFRFSSKPITIGRVSLPESLDVFGQSS